MVVLGGGRGLVDVRLWLSGAVDPGKMFWLALYATLCTVEKGWVRCIQRHRGTSRIRNSAPLGLYSRIMPRALWKPLGGGQFRMSEVPLYQGT